MIELNLKAKSNKENVEGEHYVILLHTLLDKGVDLYWATLLLAEASPNLIKYYAQNAHPSVKPDFYLNMLFPWASSTQGYSFWQKVHKEFRNGNLNPVHLLEGAHHV